MESDFVFRKATFGGFNRDDVISYIEQLKSWELTLTQELTEKDTKIKELETKVNDLTVMNNDAYARIESVRQESGSIVESYKRQYEEALSRQTQEQPDKDEKIMELEKKIEELNIMKNDAYEKIESVKNESAGEIETYKKKYEEAINQQPQNITDKDEKIIELEKKIEELTVMNNDAKEQIESIQQESNDIIESYKKKYEDAISQQVQTTEYPVAEHVAGAHVYSRNDEERVGAVMLDVRRYADMLLSETCEKIDKMSADADVATAKTLTKVFDISSVIQDFSNKLNESIADILDDNDKICNELSEFKGSLKLPFGEVSKNMGSEVFGE